MLVSTIITIVALLAIYPVPESNVAMIITLLFIGIGSSLPGMCILLIVSIYKSRRYHRLVQEQEAIWAMSDK